MKYTLLLLLSMISIWSFAQAPHNIDHKCSHQNSFANSFKNQKDVSMVADKYDMSFLHLDLLVSSSSTYVEGSVMMNATVLTSSLDTIYLELNQTLTLDSMKYNDILIEPVFEDSELFVIVEEMNEGDAFSLITYYHGASTSAGFFSGISSEHNYTYDKDVTWTLSEPFSARDWFPIRQSLEDKIDSVWQDYTCISSNMVGSNGLLTEVTENDDDTKTYHWKTNYPVSYYLLSFSVSDYMDYSIYAHPIQLDGDSVLIQNFIYNEASCLNNNKNNIDLSDDLLELFSEKYGLYPFHEEKYGNCLAEIGGGMEHQTMTTIGSFGFGLNAHEMGHQWYGDNITCATWNDIWINEGFASYSEYISAQYLQSQSTANSWMNSAHNNIMGSSGGSVYVPDEEIYYGNEWRIFNGRLTYKKGAAILHQIRYLVNDDDLFFEAMQNYTVEYTDDVATGLDYKNSIADFTGVDLDSYFEQWYFGEGYPTYAIEYSFTETGLFLAITQTTSSNVTPFFDLPLEIKLNFGAGQDTVFRIPISGNISYVQTEIQDDFIQLQIDPNNWIINKTGSISVGTSEINNHMEFVVGPNPTKGDLQLNFGNPNTVKQISILDLSGRIVKRYSTNSSITVDISDLSDGYYLVKAIDGNDIISRKILKQ